ncbi:MAG: putative transrane protein, partial [Bryobacterales bacterium]|nr:putative transrane protein [Bryobacterales bacterium]
MTPDERNMLTDLANKIAQTPPPPKDPEAEELIRTKIGSRPDALYLMTQTVLIQNMALQQAQQQLQQLQQSSGGQSSGSFLGGSRGGGSGYSQGGGGGQQYAAPP